MLCPAGVSNGGSPGVADVACGVSSGPTRGPTEGRTGVSKTPADDRTGVRNVSTGEINGPFNGASNDSTGGATGSATDGVALRRVGAAFLEVTHVRRGLAVVPLSLLCLPRSLYFRAAMARAWGLFKVNPSALYSVESADPSNKRMVPKVVWTLPFGQACTCPTVGRRRRPYKIKALDGTRFLGEA